LQYQSAQIRTAQSVSAWVRSWYDRLIAYVAASPVEFMLPPAFLGFVHFRACTIVPRTARAVRPFNIKQMKCEQCRSSIRRSQLVDQVSSRMKTFMAHTQWRINVLWGSGQFKFPGPGIYGNEHFAFLSPFNFEHLSKLARRPGRQYGTVCSARAEVRRGLLCIQQVRLENSLTIESLTPAYSRYEGQPSGRPHCWIKGSGIATARGRHTLLSNWFSSVNLYRRPSQRSHASNKPKVPRVIKNSPLKNP
jgi:hypothetical protein